MSRGDGRALPSWRLTFDNEQHEDQYDEHPGELRVREVRKAAPDAWTRLYRLEDGWKPVLVEEWPPLNLLSLRSSSRGANG